MDTIVLTENETERDKWVAIIEELQKAIRSKQMTQVCSWCHLISVVADLIHVVQIICYYG